jgi:chromosome segregation ATPase
MDSVTIRANILRQIAGRSQPFREARQEWASTEGWTTALSNVLQDSSKTLEHEHAALSTAISQYDFDAVSKRLDAAREQIDMAQFIKIPDQPVIRGAMLRKHLGALRNEVTQFNTLLDSMVQQSDSVRAEPTSADYVGHRQATHRKVIQDPQTRQEYDKLWDKIERTADAGRAVAAEYHRILDENTSIYGFDHRLNIRLPARRPWHP